MTRPRGFIYDWTPQAKSMALINAISVVLQEYSSQLPLTLRQVFYRLVAKEVIGKTESEYKRLCELANKARRADLIDFAHIRDDGFTFRDTSALESVDDFWNSVEIYARTFRLDRQGDQEHRLMVWCEAAGMVPQLETVANPFGVPVLSSGGFDSVTSKHRMAEEISSWEAVEILHIGDHDPSGVHIYYSLAEDIEAFTDAIGGYVEFSRLAVISEQIEALGLPTVPPKRTDNRAFRGMSCQAEAIPPDELANIVRSAIETRMDMGLYDEIVAKESEARAAVIMMLEGVR